METQITFICLFLVILGFSAGQEVKENLTGTVGGAVTLPDAVTETETGFLSYKETNIALVFNGVLKIIDVNTYQNRLQWNRSSGLFKITNLQRNDSGIYKVQRGTFSSSYNLQIYDPAPTPAVTAVTVTSDLCLLTCSVDKPATLLWIRDQEIQNQSRSAQSFNITVHKNNRASSYRCAAANPAENKTVDVNVTTNCGFNETETPNDRRSYIITGIVISAVLVPLVAVAAWMTKTKFQGQKPSDSPNRADSIREEEVQYTPIHFKDRRQNQEENIPEPSGSSDNNLTTVYAKLEHPGKDQNLLTASS